MKKRVIYTLTAFIMIISFGILTNNYLNFVNSTIFEESSAHLKEIYHQTNQSVQSLVGNNWNTMEMWVPYFANAESEDEIYQYIEIIRERTGFTDFYFISNQGEYTSIDGHSGYLDMKDGLKKLIVDKENIVVTSVIPGKPEILVFAIPCNNGTFKNFDYEAIAITFNSLDLVKTLEVSSFNGQSSNYIIFSDGRVLVNNNNDNHLDDVYNFIALLRNNSNLSNKDINKIQNCYNSDEINVYGLDIDGESYYLSFEAAGIEDWIILGLVPASVVNSSMNNLQQMTILIVSFTIIGFSLLIFIIVLNNYRNSLKKKDIELMYREELFSSLSTNTDDVFLMIDSKNMKVNYISPNSDRLLGISDDEIKKDVRLLGRLLTDDSELVIDQLQDLQNGQQSEWDRKYIHQKNNEIKWFHVYALCKDIQGNKKYILSLSDRTKEKKINQNLEDAVNAAISANRAKSTFLSNMSHDIRTPMNAIVGFATLAATHIDNQEKVHDYLNKILSASNHLLSLINDILDMSRIESGKLHLEENEVNLSELLHDIKTIISGQINAKSIDLYMDALDVINENIYCDRTRLNQVLLNLLSNAIKFTPANNQISLRIRQLPNYKPNVGTYIISVKDTGIGMDPEFAKRVFEPFERERNSTVSKIQGTGLGMAITKNIVDMMGGTIEVNTQLGKGTEFIVKLDFKLQTNNQIETNIEELLGLKALVIDDDFNTCDSVTKMLRQIGMKSEWTMSGKEGILRAKQAYELQDPFKAYIIDWRLPDINGIEVARQIHNMDADTPIIILTAYDFADIEKEALEAGVTSFCSKPLFMSDLKASLLHSIKNDKKETNNEQLISSQQPFINKKLLLVEDNELNREIAYEILKNYGFMIDIAQNGQEAYAKAKENNYDLILMDIQMPIMDGYEASIKIRALNNEKANIPIIAMTANAFEEDRNKAKECGMNAFVTKPININEIINTITTYL